jgi:peptidoglycan/LPS O-acetylase OafA/YrhL
VQGADPAKVAIGAATAFLGISNAYWVNCVQAGFGTCGSADFNGVTWSLSLEWQLYALLTTLICIFGRHRALAMMLAVAVFMAFLPGPSFSYVWAFRLQAFTLGALTGLALEKTTPLMNRPWYQGISLLLFVCGVLICVGAPTSLPQPFSLPAIAVGAWLCLASTLEGNVFSKFKASKPLVWIGERSYSVYLCHLPLILVTREIMFRTCGLDVSTKNIAIALVTLIVLIAISAELSYRFIEIRFQGIARQYAPSWFTPRRVEA